jgi:hypothetical protein
MLWVVGGLLAWLAVGLLFGLVIGRAVRLADQRERGAVVTGVLTTAHLPSDMIPAVGRSSPRRRVPFPPVAVVLAGVGLALEAVGYAVRLSDARGQVATLLSMDAPFSVPRLYVSALFAAAAIAALMGGASLGGRRRWWMGVALVAGGVAAVKAGSTLHYSAFIWVSEAVGEAGAILASLGVAGAVIGWLWLLAPGERRDRRRVLGTLSVYAGASVGLSAVSTVVAGAFGAGRWTAMATFVEESGEALSAVAFLVAVLVGVAPRLVLPADWALRRSADRYTLEVPEAASGPVAGRRPAR